jgi:hypothetical protein
MNGADYTMTTKCPKCGAKIVYSYNIDNGDYYLRCDKNYNHFSERCDKSTALKYPEKITAKERLVDDIMDALEDDDIDYYNGFSI